MNAAFTAWEELWFAEGDDDETRQRKSARDWESLLFFLGPSREQDEWEAAIRRAKLALGRERPPPIPRDAEMRTRRAG